MRFTTTSGHHSHPIATRGLSLAFALLLTGLLPQAGFAYTVSDASGCFERETNVIRGTEPSCTFTITPSTATESIALSTENIDPDTVTANTVGDNLAISYDTTVQLSGTLTQPTTITIEPWYEITDDLWFVAISDNQARGTVESNPVFEDMLPIINRINPPFLTNSGDLVQGSSNDETLNDMFAAVLGSLVDITVPMYPIAGNHDYDPGLATYQSYFGPIDYSYDVGPARLIALSTSGSSSKGTVSDDQLTWLDDELTSTDLQTIVTAHHAVSVPSWGSTECCYLDTTERDALAAVLDADQVGLLVAGHSQGYDYRFLTSSDVSTIVTGFNQLVTGGAGGNIKQPDGDFHFTLIHATPTAITPLPFYLTDTSLQFDETNNTGTKDRAIITSEFLGEVDLPYLRLKFDLRDQPDATYLISDAAGNYLSYQSHLYDDHVILLTETAQSKNTTVDYTASIADQLHTGTTNTFDADGYAQFAAMPSTTATNTHINVEPSKLTTSLSEVNVTATGYQWIETPATRSVDTTYTVEDLSAATVISVYLNGDLEKRVVSENGSASFTLSHNANQRQVEVVLQSSNVLDNIALAPASDGSAQIRFFKADGSNLRNFTTYDGYSGGFNLSYGNITDSSTPNLLISRPDQKVGLFSQTGTRYDTVASTGAVHTGDIQGNSQAELVVEQNRNLRTYKWSNSQAQLDAIDQLRLPRGLLDWMIWDGKLVTLSSDGNSSKLRSYRWADQGWRLQHHKRVTTERTSHLVSVNDGLAVVTDSRIALYNSKLKRLKQKAIPTQRFVQAISGQLSNKTLDTLMLLSEDGKIYPYQTQSNHRLKALPAIPANAQMITAVQFNDRSYQSLITTSRTAAPMVSTYHYSSDAATWTQRYQFSAYGNSFPGLANLAVQ